MPTHAQESFPSRQFINTLGFVACAGLLGFGYYLQFYQGLEPCPLCIFQRLAFMALGVVFFIAALHNPMGWGSRFYALLIAIAAGVGAALAYRHIYIQGLPADQVPECGPELDYMLDVLPLFDVVRKVLTGSGECADIQWSFMDLTIPQWALIAFAAMGIVGFIRNLIVTRQR